MPISFSCHQCGRNLKAPDDAAGKSSKCPGCGATVTCPDEVYDAELLEAPSAEAVGYAVPDPAGAYAMTAAPAASTATEEARRPCPICGEMIIATAAKCRFCGEVFDEVLKGAGLGGKEARTIASAQRNLVISVVLWIVFGVTVQVLVQRNAVADDPAMGIVALVVVAITVAAYVAVACYVFMLARRMYNIGIGLLLAFLTIVPIANLLIAFMVNQRVNRYLQDNGYEVGLFGAKVP